MKPKRDWQVRFPCAACGTVSLVSVSAMKSVLRCPHCRKRLVVGKDGLQKISPSPGLGAQVGSLETVENRRTTPANASRRPVHPGTKKVAVAGVILLSLAGLWATTSSVRQFQGSTNAADRSPHEVASKAEVFLLAWLADDMQTAEAFVMDVDLAFFSQWWSASRASSVASFGRALDGTVTAVDVRPETTDRCEVRLSFTVNGREQQIFQDWVRNATGWSIDFSSTPTGD